MLHAIGSGDVMCVSSTVHKCRVRSLPLKLRFPAPMVAWAWVLEDGKTRVGEYATICVTTILAKPVGGKTCTRRGQTHQTDKFTVVQE